MLFDLPHIKLPQEFVGSMKDISLAEREKMECVKANSSTYTFLNAKLFNGRYELTSIYSQYGWGKVREILAEFYLSHFLHGDYVTSDTSSFSVNVNEFCQRFTSFSPERIDRIYLLGFYLQAVSYSKNIEGKSGRALSESFDPIIDLMNAKKVRSEKMDYILLMTWHWYYGLGKDRLYKVLEGKKSYQQIFQLLTDKQQAQYIYNMANYSLSIFEDEMLVS